MAILRKFNFLANQQNKNIAARGKLFIHRSNSNENRFRRTFQKKTKPVNRTKLTMDAELIEICDQFEAENKVARKRALEKALNFLEKSKNSTTELDFWEKSHKVLFKRLQDESERCREIATNIVNLIFQRNTDSDPK